MENNTPVQNVQKDSSLFTKSQRNSFYVALGLLFISSVATFLSKNVSSGFSSLVMAWYGGVILGLVTTIVSFVSGLVHVREDHGKMLLSSLILLLAIVVVGFGTCMFNLSGVGL